MSSAKGKLWRRYGKERTLNARAQRGHLGSIIKLNDLLEAQATHGFRKNPGVPFGMVLLSADYGLEFAHEYIKPISQSKAAVQNRDRKAALAGRVLSAEEHQYGAIARRQIHNRRSAPCSSDCRWNNTPSNCRS